jgi:hypothetical protein
MSTCLFLSFRFDAEPAVDETAKLERLLSAAPQLRKALVHSPASASDPYVKDGAPPALVLQLYFAELPELEAAVSRNGPLGALASHAEFPVLAKAEIAQQAMLVRSFAVPDPAFKTPPGTPHCTYLVSYEGEAEDLNAWHAHYFESHIAHMAMFPGIRELEVYTRLDWVSLQPWRRANFMQRNKVVFDDAAALDRALQSPVRHAMRADFNAFPKFSGPNRHYAVATRALALPRS